MGPFCYVEHILQTTLKVLYSLYLFGHLSLPFTTSVNLFFFKHQSIKNTGGQAWLVFCRFIGNSDILGLSFFFLISKIETYFGTKFWLFFLLLVNQKCVASMELCMKIKYSLCASIYFANLTNNTSIHLAACNNNSLTKFLVIIPNHISLFLSYVI